MIFDKTYARGMLNTYIKDVYKEAPESLLRDDPNLFTVTDDIVSKLWDTCLSASGGYKDPINGLTTGMVINTLQDKGIDVRAKKRGQNNIIITLPNHEYWITDGNGYIESYPVKLTNLFMRWITMTAEAFADFLIEFDGFLSEVKEEMKKVAMDMKKQVLLLDIARNTIRGLEDSLLAPHGVSFQSVSYIDQDGFAPVFFAKEGHKDSYRIKLDISRIKESLIEVPALIGKISPSDRVTITV